jgi:hypothetical protein
VRDAADEHNWPAILVEQPSMGIAYLHERKTAFAAGTLLLSLSLGGCASSGSSLMDARAEAPSPPTAYLPVQDLPPPRDKPAMTLDERVKVQKELNALRDSQKARAARPEPTKP